MLTVKSYTNKSFMQYLPRFIFVFPTHLQKYIQKNLSIKSSLQHKDLSWVLINAFYRLIKIIR